MQKIKGIVDKTGKGRYSWYVRLRDDERYFNTRYEPKCNEGDEVGIKYEPKGASRGNIQELVVLNKNASPPTRRGYSTGGSGGDARQQSIVWQHSQGAAARLLLVMSNESAIPGTDPGENPSVRFANIRALFDQFTAQLYHDAMDPENSEAFKASKTGEAANPEDDWDKPDQTDDTEDDWDDWEN